jgi:hypothetical protein
VCQPGDVVAIEQPAYFGTLLLLEDLGLKALAIPTDLWKACCWNRWRTPFAATARGRSGLAHRAKPFGCQHARRAQAGTGCPA